ncbi:NAD(P)-binding protein [Myriangium duriaei CBS 260.36]|uniref:NAD(P)-binding protein n=1 Tax=Myriangium duriaei CBS 260.36 TaxID=1168546 RepID=A0A9P4MRX3_9PEZI|nr:NAD(P)-binding protein [Myriangium duriaei CBS 260.36]
MSGSISSPNNNNDFKLDNLFDVKDRVVVITGGGSGIGLMATQAFAVNGAKVYIIGRTLEKLETVAKTYGKDVPGQIIPLQGDISDKKDIARLYEEIKKREKCVCVLINNAGISSNTLQTEAKSAEEMKANLFDNEDSNIEDWVDTYRTNVPQCFFMTTAFLPLLRASTEHHKGYSGCVINVCSISGIVKTAQHHFAYNASKAAVIHLTKMLGWEIANNGLKIRVNSIAPGVFPSEMTSDTTHDNQKSEIPKEKFEGKVPADRPGNDKDMAQGMLFVTANQYINGQTIVIDGGYVLKAGSA